jgi:hypothetical protein
MSQIRKKFVNGSPSWAAKGQHTDEGKACRFSLQACRALVSMPEKTSSRDITPLVMGFSLLSIVLLGFVS